MQFGNTTAIGSAIFSTKTKCEGSAPPTLSGTGNEYISVARWVKLLQQCRTLANAYTKERQMWCICR